MKPLALLFWPVVFPAFKLLKEGPDFFAALAVNLRELREMVQDFSRLPYLAREVERIDRNQHATVAWLDNPKSKGTLAQAIEEAARRSEDVPF